MTTKIQIKKQPRLKDPKWSKADALPGDEVELSVTAENLDAQHSVHFEVRDAADQIVAVLPADASHKKKWFAPSPPGAMKFNFFALLREKPAAKNGHIAVAQRLKSADLEVKGAKLTIVSSDDAFVPKQEKIEVKYNLEGTPPAKGRIEIWGERYPTKEPLYSEDFVPAAGETEWKTWDGKSKDGKKYLNSQTADAYLTPEFSPYRLRIIAGPDDDSVKDPYGKGKDKVALVEKPFEVAIESVHIRLQDAPLRAKTSECSLKISKSPQFYMPGDKLTIEYELTGTAPAKGRYEIWGTGYAGNKPLYKEDFVPAAGTKTWNTWLGKGNEGALNNQEITKDYLPYRLRIIVGPDDEKIEAPFDKGLGKVSFVEALFELHERLDDKYKYRLGYVLAVEPRNADGSFAAMNRLPKEGEQGRLRIAMARHQNDADPLSQGGPNVSNGYMKGGANTKYAIDETFYTRPQMPLEFVPHLRSRVKAINDDTDRKGLFEPEATGPLEMEPVAEDHYLKDLYDTSADTKRRTYWRNAVHKVKWGKHNDPRQQGSKARYRYWQWCKKMDADVTTDTEYNIAAFDSTLSYKVGAAELTVWLNRTRLVLKVDYEEVGAASATVSKIKLKKNVAKKDDVLWVVRCSSVSSSISVAKWNNFPPGNNCHVHYGGLRGKDANNLFLQDYAAHTGGSHEPILLKGTTPYAHKDKRHINLKPDDQVAVNQQERVEVTALTAGTTKGLAGIIFSPSYIAGDSYVLKVQVDDTPYTRNLGCVSTQPMKEAKSGPLTIWRWLRIGKSLRLPDQSSCGFTNDPDENNTPTGTPVADDAIGSRTYRGDGYNMKISDMNTTLDGSFHEWTIAPPVEICDAKAKAAVMITRATAAKPIEITTGADHGLETGDGVKIKDAKGNTKTNGEFVITKVDARKFTLNDSDGTGQGAYSGSGKVLKPIEVTTRTPHGLETDDVVRVTDVDGLAGANGSFPVKVIDNKKILLIYSDGTKMDGSAAGPYKSGGLIDVHRGVNLKKYRDAHNGFGQWGAGKVDLTGNDKIRNRIVQWDHYRVQLPPGFPADRVKVASKTINDLNTVPKGMVSNKAKEKVKQAVQDWEAANPPANPGDPIPDDVAYGGPDIPVFAPNDPDDYEEWVEEIVDNGVAAVMNALIPKEAQPKEVNTIRWPKWYDTHWVKGANYKSTSSYTTGIYQGEGQSFFRTFEADQGTFEHEMGHSCHLAHFVAGNFEWKHHDLNSPDCLMSYDYTAGVIIKAAGNVGTNGASVANGGWPHVVPNPLPDPCGIAGSGNYGDPCIQFGPGLPRGKPCAKCVLKLRGWNDEVLPCAWNHPDLF